MWANEGRLRDPVEKRDHAKVSFSSLESRDVFSDAQSVCRLDGRHPNEAVIEHHQPNRKVRTEAGNVAKSGSDSLSTMMRAELIYARELQDAGIGVIDAHIRSNPNRGRRREGTASFDKE